MTKKRWWAVCAAAVAVLTSGVAVTAVGSADPAPDGLPRSQQQAIPTPHGLARFQRQAIPAPDPLTRSHHQTNPAPDGLTRFQRQVISWHDCRLGPGDDIGASLDAVGGRCGEIQVPLDYTRPAGRTITVALSRRPATDPARRLGTLFVNTGGPGESLDAVSFVARQAPAVADRYDLVGIDPRFFGRSTPLDCGWPTDVYLRDVAQLATPDRPAFDRSVAAAKDLAGRCAPWRDLLPYASTRDIARDMDVVRAVLRQRRISYLGWSYGTYLGSVYLQLFPGRTDRTVLDSSVDPNAYGPDLTRHTAPADAAALRDWARWAAGHDARYGLGDTTDRVLATVAAIYRAAWRQPLRIGGHVIDADLLPGLLLTADDSDATYADLAAQVRGFRDAAQGRPVTPTPTEEQKLDLYDDPAVVPELALSATLANQCADRSPAGATESYYRDIQAHLASEPFYGPLARHVSPCVFWPTGPVEPPTTIGTDTPVLMVGADGDPAAPYGGQLVLHRLLSGSRLVTLAGAFRHGVYLFDPSACVRDTVEHYLLGAALPHGDITCARA
jgi:pimeloyl-ACP methyl ester carboxylesterase